MLVLVPTEDYGTQTNCRIVPIWMGMAEGTTLGIILDGHTPARPMTPVLFAEALHKLGAAVDRVEITRVEGYTFFSQLVLRTHERIITLDARPSDAIALALLQNAPIYMANEVLDAASYPYLFRQSPENAKELEDFKDFVESLTPNDFLEE